jgi:predicted nucleic acid-binding protein
LRIYLDSSELVHRAQAIQAAGLWRPPLDSLDANAYSLATSAISHVEISRTLLRSESPDAAKQLARQTLIDVDSLAPSAAILELAATLPVSFLKSLDAIHVASALQVQADVVLTRDRQMQRACEALGLANA